MTKSNNRLSPARAKFVEVYSKTDNATEAVRQAFPELAKNPKGSKYMTLKGARMLANDGISNAIMNQKAKLEQLSNRAVQRVAELIESDNEQVATTNVWKTIEQVHGKARQLTEVTANSMTLSIDLTSALDDSTTLTEAEAVK